MNLPLRPLKKKKFQATATARRIREPDYTEEPNVKLSSAFIVVLVLHVVAVGGIYAFNAIKARQPAAFEETETPQPPAAQQPVANTQITDTPAAEATPAAADSAPRTYRVRSGDTIARIAAANGVDAAQLIDMNDLRAQGGIHVGQILTLPGSSATRPADPAPRPALTRDSGATYTVVHGDTPVGIARKLHVGYDDLIRLNKIEDPKKLKIGMKLKIPAKHPTA